MISNRWIDLISVTFDKDEGIALLRWLNYLFTSLMDFEAIRESGDQDELDKAELAFRRAIDDTKNITPEHTQAIISKMDTFWQELVKSGEAEVSDIDSVEIVNTEVAEA